MNARISIDPEICHGKACIRGTRIMVHQVLGMLGGGYGMDEIVRQFPELERDDILAAVAYAGEVVKNASTQPVR